MLHINVVCVGKIKESFFRDAISEYSKRLSRFCNLNIVNHLRKDSYVIALDLKGKEFDSVEFSKKISDISFSHSDITFIIGGSLGLSSSVLNVCNASICFSKMTFPHQLIRIFLLEQIYRGFKIANNETYHK